MPGGEKSAKINESTNKLHFWSRGSKQAERIAKRVEEEKEEKNRKNHVHLASQISCLPGAVSPIANQGTGKVMKEDVTQVMKNGESQSPQCRQ